MRIIRAGRLLAILLLACGWSHSALAAYCSGGRPVVFAGVNWESGEFITAVMREIFSRGFGCRTQDIPGNSVTLEPATADNDVQVFAEEWVSRSDVWKAAADAGKVQAVGHPFLSATEGWYVPAYLVHGDPSRHIAAAAADLTSVSQLGEPKYVALFRDPEQPNKGRFLNCPSGWTCEGVNTAKLHAYGLEGAYVDFRPGTGTAMDAAITSAYLQGQPVLFYYFSPSTIVGKLKLIKLIEPPYTPGCYKDLTSTDGKHTHGCAAPPADVAYGVSTPFVHGAPELTAVLAKATFPLADLNANLVEMADAKRDAPAQALVFLKARPDIWRRWVDPATAARIQASLDIHPNTDASDDGATARAPPFPPGLTLSIRQPVNAAVAALVSQHGAAFRAASGALLAVVVASDTVLNLCPWWLLIAIFMALAWLGSRRLLLSAVVGVLMFTVGVLGLWSLMLQTLTLMLISSVIALMIGLPVGIAVAKVRLVRAVTPPVLDVMQTMPSFVYLIPALMLFGLGKAPAILATVIYAVAPMIRLTALGLDLVDPEIREAATAFGVTPWQMLFWVELPLARPSIMAGVNQTIMLALSMVVVASMIGARGLGEQVLNGIQTLNVGQGLEAGIGIVILAVVLDRITQGFGARTRQGGAGARS